MALLAFQIALAWVTVQASLLLIQLVWHALGGAFLPGGEAGSIARHLAWLRVAQGAGWLATAAVFPLWLHRAYRALPALGIQGPAVSGREVAAAMLLPGLNLVWPLHLVGALWRACDPARPPGRATSAWVGWWWGVVLASLLLDLAVGPRGPLHPGRGGLPLAVLAECTRGAAAALTMVIVGRVGRFQAERLEARGA